MYKFPNRKEFSSTVCRTLNLCFVTNVRKILITKCCACVFCMELTGRKYENHKFFSCVYFTHRKILLANESPAQ